MGDNCMTVEDAWRVYDKWLRESIVGFCHEPAELDSLFRLATAPVSRLSSLKALGDCYLLAVSQAANATLVTFVMPASNAWPSRCTTIHSYWSN